MLCTSPSLQLKQWTYMFLIDDKLMLMSGDLKTLSNVFISLVVFRNILLGLFPKMGNGAGYPPDHTYIFYSSSYLAVIHYNHQIQSNSQRFIWNSSYAKHILTEGIHVCSIERSWIVVTFGRFFLSEGACLIKVLVNLFIAWS